MKQRLKRKITSVDDLLINGEKPAKLGKKIKLSNDVVKKFKKERGS